MATAQRINAPFWSPPPVCVTVREQAHLPPAASSLETADRPPAPPGMLARVPRHPDDVSLSLWSDYSPAATVAERGEATLASASVHECS